MVCTGPYFLFFCRCRYCCRHDCCFFISISCCKSTFFCTGVSNWLDLWWSWSTACLLKTLSGLKMSFPFYWSSHFLCLRSMSIFFIFVMGFSQGYYVLFQVKKSTYRVSQKKRTFRMLLELSRAASGKVTLSRNLAKVTLPEAALLSSSSILKVRFFGTPCMFFDKTITSLTWFF